MNNKAFTLIELLVVVGVFGIILITMSTILINSTRAKNRTAIIQNLDANGNMILDKIKYNLINADPSTIVCPADVGSSVAFIDKMGVGDSTVLICSDEAGVASASANGTLGLNANSVTVSGCGSFISCSTFPVTGEVEIVNVGFTLVAGDQTAPLGSSISRGFSTRVTVRQ